MLTLFYTVGLPASGKSTHARRMVEESNGELIAVSKDELRLLPDAPSGRKKERWVVQRQTEIIRQALAAGRSVVVHDTNFNPVHPRRFAELAREFNAHLEKIDFTHVDVQECIRRDAARLDHVGESVIMGMWQKYCYSPPISVPNHQPSAVLVDLDGTLARMTNRSPYEWHRVGEDEPVPHVVELVRDLASAGTSIVFMSGRDGSCRDATQEWLDTHVGVPGPLFMRAPGDSRSDSIVKRELFDAHVRDVYRVRFVLDDRNAVVHMWRSMGVPVFQVDYGYF